MLALLSFLLSFMLCCLGLELWEPPIADLNSGPTNFTVAPCQWLVKDENGNLLLNYTTRAYWWYGSCTIPGATWLMRPNQSTDVTLINNLSGSGAYLEGGNYPDQTSPAANQFHDPDVINFHTHGLHVSPFVDNVLVKIYPKCHPKLLPINHYGCNTKTNHTYKYEIGNHYPGTHWYHDHHHGGTTAHMMGGLFGAIIVPDAQPTGMKDTVLVVSFLFATNRSLCEDNSQFGAALQKQQNFTYTDPAKGTVNCRCSPWYYPNNFTRIRHKWRSCNPINFPLVSTCNLYCAVPCVQQQFTLDYLVFTQKNESLKLSLVNGMVKPTMKMNTSEWRRLRITNANMNFLQLEFPVECSASLMSLDGVYFDSPRDLWNTSEPYNGVVYIAIGGRADVAIRCYTAGKYTIRSLRSEYGGEFYLAPLNPHGNETLMYIESTGATQPKESFSFVVPPKPAYLRDLLSPQEQVTSDCASNASSWVYTNGKLSLINNTQCGLNFQRQNSTAHIDGKCTGQQWCLPQRTGMNNILFDSKQYLMRVPYGKTFEYLVTSNFHPFHHHTWPVQVVNDIAGGLVAKRGDWRDTLIARESFLVRVHYDTWPNSNLIIHCHFLGHEDHGMMALIHVVNETLESVSSLPPPSNVVSVSNPLTAGCPNVHMGSRLLVNTVSSKFWWSMSLLPNCTLSIKYELNPRRVAPRTFWFGIGFDSLYFADKSKSRMQGRALVINFAKGSNANAYQAFGYYEVDLLNSYEVTRTINYFDCGGETNFKQMNIGATSEVVLSLECSRQLVNSTGDVLKSILVDNVIDTTKEYYYVWAYGEGVWNDQTYHAARGFCSMRFTDTSSPVKNTTCSFGSVFNSVTDVELARSSRVVRSCQNGPGIGPTRAPTKNPTPFPKAKNTTRSPTPKPVAGMAPSVTFVGVAACVLLAMQSIV